MTSVRGTGLLLVLAIVLAGCSGSDDAPEDPKETTPTVGKISGVVVTPAIQPVQGITVTLEPGMHSDESDIFGRFRFEALPPGSYRLTASAPDYLPAAATVDVQAGQTARPRLVVEPDLPPLPRHETVGFTGRIDAWLGPGDGPAGPVKDAAGAGNCTCTFDLPVPRYLAGLTIEAVWEQDVEPPEGSTYQWNLTLDGQTINGTGSSPLHAVVTDDDVPGLNTTQQARITLVPDAVWPTSDQSYELFVTLWEVAPPDPDWSYVAGDK